MMSMKVLKGRTAENCEKAGEYFGSFDAPPPLKLHIVYSDEPYVIIIKAPQ